MTTMQRIAKDWLESLRSFSVGRLIDRKLGEWLEAIAPELWSKTHR